MTIAAHKRISSACDSTATSSPVRRRAIPTPIQAARLMFVLLAAGHIATLVLLSREQSTALTDPLLLHIPLFGVCAALALALSTGSPWARRPATVSQLFAVTFSLILWSSSLSYRPLVPAMDIIGIAAVGLLWAPTKTRAFFRHAVTEGAS